MFVYLILLFFILPTLSAPTWCYVLSWIGFGLSVATLTAKAVETFK